MQNRSQFIEQPLALIQKVKTGDRLAFRELYQSYSGAILGILVKMVEQQPLAEEILQDTFLKVWNKIDQYDETKGRFFTWLVRIARNTAIDRIKTKKFQRNSANQTIEDVDAQSAQFATEMKVEDSGLNKVVAGLKEKHRILIDYLYYRGYTQKETSEALDMPLGTVKTEIRKAILQLRALLAEDDPP